MKGCRVLSVSGKPRPLAPPAPVPRPPREAVCRQSRFSQRPCPFRRPHPAADRRGTAVSGGSEGRCCCRALPVLGKPRLFARQAPVPCPPRWVSRHEWRMLQARRDAAVTTAPAKRAGRVCVCKLWA